MHAASFPHSHSPYYECYARRKSRRAVEMAGGGQLGDSQKAAVPNLTTAFGKLAQLKGLAA